MFDKSEEKETLTTFDEEFEKISKLLIQASKERRLLREKESVEEKKEVELEDGSEEKEIERSLPTKDEDLYILNNFNSLPKLDDSHDQECQDISSKEECLQSSQENEVNQVMLVLEEDCSKVPQEEACKEVPGLNPPNFDHPTSLIDKSLVKLFDKFLPPMLVWFENSKVEMPNSYPFHNPSLSFETMKHERVSPHYSSKLDLRIVSQDLNEFLDKSIVVLSNFNLAHDNILEGCFGIPKERLFANLNTFPFVKNKVSTLRFLWNSKSLHVELIDDSTTTFLFTLPICTKSLELPYDNLVVLEKVAMIGKEQHFVYEEKSYHGVRCELELWQQQSTFSCVTNCNSRKVNLGFNVNFKRYNFLPSFKIPYLGNIDVESLTTKDAIVSPLLGLCGEFSQFPFDPGGEFYNVFMSLTCAYLHVGHVGAKIRGRISSKREGMMRTGNDEDREEANKELSKDKYKSWLLVDVLESSEAHKLEEDLSFMF